MNIFPVHVCLLIGNMSAAEDPRPSFLAGPAKKEKRLTIQSASWIIRHRFRYQLYWVGESNSYCKIENLEY